MVFPVIVRKLSTNKETSCHYQSNDHQRDGHQATRRNPPRFASTLEHGRAVYIQLKAARAVAGSVDAIENSRHARIVDAVAVHDPAVGNVAHKEAAPSGGETGGQLGYVVGNDDFGGAALPHLAGDVGGELVFAVGAVARDALPPPCIFRVRDRGGGTCWACARARAAADGLQRRARSGSDRGRCGCAHCENPVRG